MKLKEILIAIGFVLATTIAYGLGLLDLKWAVTGILVELALAWVLSKIIKEKQIEAKGLAKAITEESEKQNEKEALVEHSKILVNKNLQFRINTYVGFTHQYGLNLCVEGKPNEVDTPEYRKYLREVDNHLESGYWEDVWKYGVERDSFVNDHNCIAQTFLENTIKEIIREAKKKIPSLIEWDGDGQPPSIKYFIPQYLAFDVGYVLQYSYERTFNIDEYCIVKQEGDRWNISINRIFAESDNKDDMEQFKLTIKTVLNSSHIKGNVRKLSKIRAKAREKHVIYKNGITEIIKSVENRIPLNGRCKICDEIRKSFSKPS